MMAEDALPLAVARSRHDHLMGENGPWAVNGGAPLVAPATITRTHMPVKPSSQANLMHMPPTLVMDAEKKIFVPGKPFNRNSARIAWAALSHLSHRD